MANLMYEGVKSTLGSAAVAATTSETTTAVVDMQNFDELEYEVIFGDCANGSVITLTPKENTASSTSSPTPTAITIALGATNTNTAVITSGAAVVTATATSMDSKIVRIALVKSAMTKRYQFLSITAATANYALIGVVVHQRKSRSTAVSQSSDVVLTAYAAA